MTLDLRAPLIAVSLAGSIGLADVAVAETSVSADPADVQRAAMADPMVCKRMAPTGSRIVRRYCLKRSEWDAMREGGQQAARDAAIEESQFGYRGIGPTGTNPY